MPFSLAETVRPEPVEGPLAPLFMLRQAQRERLICTALTQTLGFPVTARQERRPDQPSKMNN